MKKKPYDEEYWSAIRELQTCNSPEKAREIHKRLKPYGDGLYFSDRYPRAHIYAAWVAVGINSASLIISLAVLIYKLIG